MGTNSTTQIKVITGSTREGRFSPKAAEWIAGLISTQEDVKVEILDLAVFDLPFFDQPVSPSFNQGDYPHKNVVKFTKAIDEADGYVMVTPEYNRGTSAVLKNALDWVYREWNNKPVAFVSYGSVGGARAVEQLRLNTIELQMAPIREGVHFVGNEYFPVMMGKEEADGLFEKHEASAESMIDQLMWWTKALKQAREK